MLLSEEDPRRGLVVGQTLALTWLIESRVREHEESIGCLLDSIDVEVKEKKFFLTPIASSNQFYDEKWEQLFEPQFTQSNQKNFWTFEHQISDFSFNDEVEPSASRPPPFGKSCVSNPVTSGCLTFDIMFPVGHSVFDDHEYHCGWAPIEIWLN